jgi:hypothetical protein
MVHMKGPGLSTFWQVLIKVEGRMKPMNEEVELELPRKVMMVHSGPKRPTQVVWAVAQGIWPVGTWQPHAWWHGPPPCSLSAPPHPHPIHELDMFRHEQTLSPEQSLRLPTKSLSRALVYTVTALRLPTKSRHIVHWSEFTASLSEPAQLYAVNFDYVL